MLDSCRDSEFSKLGSSDSYRLQLGTYDLDALEPDYSDCDASDLEATEFEASDCETSD